MTLSIFDTFVASFNSKISIPDALTPVLLRALGAEVEADAAGGWKGRPLFLLNLNSLRLIIISNNFNNCVVS